MGNQLGAEGQTAPPLCRKGEGLSSPDRFPRPAAAEESSASAFRPATFLTEPAVHCTPQLSYARPGRGRFLGSSAVPGGGGRREGVLPLGAVKVALPSRPRLTVGKALPWTPGPLSLRPVQGAFGHAAFFCRLPSLSRPPPPRSPRQARRKALGQ